MHIGHDRIDILRFFFRRVGVVHANVADAAEFVGDAEVQANRFGVADVEIAVRLWRKTCLNFRPSAAANVLRHDIADEVGRSGSVGRRSHVAGEATEQDVDSQPAPSAGPSHPERSEGPHILRVVTLT